MASATELTNYFGPISLCVIGMWQLVKWRTKRREKAAERATAAAALSQSDAIKNDANLRDDQRELLAKLYERDDVSQTRIDRLVQQNDELHEQIVSLRREIESLRQEVAVARRAQEAAEARYLKLLEQQQHPPGDDA